MVDRTVVLETANELIKAQEIIVEGLGPIADDWLKKYHQSEEHFLDKENAWRDKNLRGEERDPLYTDLQGRIVWDFSPLLNTVISKGRWEHFVKTQRKHGLTIKNKQQTFLDIKTLVNLRDQSVGHRTLGEFTRDDYREFFLKAERVLRTLGAEAQAEKLLPKIPAVIADIPKEVDLGDLHFTQVLTYPQWAAEPKIISLLDYGRSSILIKGHFSSPSSYFRFGFKLMDARDKVFSPGSIQTEGQNIVFHVGINLREDDLFITVYKNGIRLDRNRVLMQYVRDRKLPISLELSKGGINKFYVDEKLSYETFFESSGPAQLVILAWGDEHHFECDFRQATVTRIES